MIFIFYISILESNLKYPEAGSNELQFLNSLPLYCGFLESHLTCLYLSFIYFKREILIELTVTLHKKKGRILEFLTGSKGLYKQEQ